MRAAAGRRKAMAAGFAWAVGICPGVRQSVAAATAGKAAGRGGQKPRRKPEKTPENRRPEEEHAEAWGIARVLLPVPA